MDNKRLNVSLFYCILGPFILSTRGLAASQSALLLFKQEAAEEAPWPSEAEPEKQEKQEQHL